MKEHELLCVGEHSRNIVEIGKTYPLIKETKCWCGCEEMRVDVGIKSAYPKDSCYTSGKTRETKDNIWWLNKNLFVDIKEKPVTNDYLIF